MLRAGKYFATVMKKAIANDDFVAKETARLQALIAGDAVAVAQLDSMHKRLNALATFL